MPPEQVARLSAAATAVGALELLKLAALLHIADLKLPVALIAFFVTAILALVAILFAAAVQTAVAAIAAAEAVAVAIAAFAFDARLRPYLGRVKLGLSLLSALGAPD